MLADGRSPLAPVRVEDGPNEPLVDGRMSVKASDEAASRELPEEREYARGIRLGRWAQSHRRAVSENDVRDVSRPRGVLSHAHSDELSSTRGTVATVADPNGGAGFPQLGAGLVRVFADAAAFDG